MTKRWNPKPRRVADKKDLELELLSQMRLLGLPEPEREFMAITGRKFRFDFAWVFESGGCRGVLVECQGGIYQYAPSHASAAGIRRDAEKMNLAVSEGWRVYHFTSDMIRSGAAVQMIERELRMMG